MPRIAYQQTSREAWRSIQGIASDTLDGQIVDSYITPAEARAIP